MKIIIVNKFKHPLNLSSVEFIAKDGERIYEMIISRHERVKFESVAFLEKTDRGNGGFEHTGNE